MHHRVQERVRGPVQDRVRALHRDRVQHPVQGGLRVPLAGRGQQQGVGAHPRHLQEQPLRRVQGRDQAEGEAGGLPRVS